MNVKPNHPLAEVLGCKLMGIEVVPQKEQTKMVNRAIKAAVEWANTKEHNTLLELLHKIQADLIIYSCGCSFSVEHHFKQKLAQKE